MRTKDDVGRVVVSEVTGALLVLHLARVGQPGVHLVVLGKTRFQGHSAVLQLVVSAEAVRQTCIGEGEERQGKPTWKEGHRSCRAIYPV